MNWLVDRICYAIEYGLSWLLVMALLVGVSSVGVTFWSIVLWLIR